MYKLARLAFGLIIWLFASSIMTGQTDSVERIYVITPPNGTLKIKNSYIDLNKENQPVRLRLPEGEYPVKIWAPYMAVHLDTLDFNGGKTDTIRRIQLKKYHPDFERFKNELDAYDTKRKMKFLKYATIGAVNIGLTATTIVLYNGIGPDIEKLERLIDHHPNIIHKQNLELNRSQYKKLKEDIKRKETIVYAVAIPLTLISYGLSTVAVMKLNKEKIVKPDPFVPVNPLVPAEDESLGGYFELKSNGTGIALTYTF